MTDATVRLWGSDIGAVSWIAERDIGVFQYMPDFESSGIQLAPITMPLRLARITSRSTALMVGVLSHALMPGSSR